ncbi:hypothetical protein F4776DRAFT_191857 [Hypoxylon sp. NC0597]|nr:hypothetical protein F4776DRAFT_191857 [Hypoxylon sp. NC0597]
MGYGASGSLLNTHQLLFLRLWPVMASGLIPEGPMRKAISGPHVADGLARCMVRPRCQGEQVGCLSYFYCPYDESPELTIFFYSLRTKVTCCLSYSNREDSLFR